MLKKQTFYRNLILLIGIGTPITERPSHTAGRTGRVFDDLAFAKAYGETSRLTEQKEALEGIRLRVGFGPTSRYSEIK